MPTQGWGDSWGDMPWGGQEDSGEVIFNGAAFLYVIPSSVLSVAYEFIGNVSLTIAPSSQVELNPAISGAVLSLLPSSEKELGIYGSAGFELIPSSVVNTGFQFVGNAYLYLTPSSIETRDIVLIGSATIGFFPSFVRFGWVRNFRKESIFQCPTRASSIWTESQRPSTLYAEVSR